MTFQTIAGRSDGVFWWFPTLSEDQENFCWIHQNYLVALYLSHIYSTAAVELQNRVIPAVAVEILRWPQGHRTANPYVLQAAGVAVEL